MRLPKQDSATGRALKTAAQAIIGFAVGLVVVVWNVPGVPDAVVTYTKNNIAQVLLSVGVPAGLTAWVWNFYGRKDVPKY